MKTRASAVVWVAKLLPPEAHHRIAGRQAGHIRPDADDPAGALETEHRPGKAVIQHVVIEQPGRQHDIAEVEARRRDLNLDLTAPRRRPRDFGPVEFGLHPPRTQRQPRRRHRRAGTLQAANRPDRRDADAVDQQFRIRPRCGEKVGKVPGRCVRVEIQRDIDQPDLDLRIFVHCHPGKAPHGFGDRIDGVRRRGVETAHQNPEAASPRPHHIEDRRKVGDGTIQSAIGRGKGRKDEIGGLTRREGGSDVRPRHGEICRHGGARHQRGTPIGAQPPH